MPGIKLTEKKYAQLEKYTTDIKAGKKRMEQIREQTDNQIESLINRRQEILGVLDAVWESVYLADPDFRDLDIPPMLDEDGTQLVTLDKETQTASWGEVPEK